MSKTELMVSIENVKQQNWLGDPLNLSTQQLDGSYMSVHADVTDLVKSFLRARDNQSGQSLVVKSLEDSERVRVIGMALRDTTNGVLQMPFGEHKWLVDKAKEVGWRFLPNDASIFIEALQAGQKANVPAPVLVIE